MDLSKSNHGIKKSSRRTTRRVTFDEQLNQYQQGPKELTLDTQANLWFQPNEYEELRAETKQDSIKGIEDGVDFYLSKTYGCTDEKTQDMLNHFTGKRHTLRGLERFINPSYAEARMRIRMNYLKVVIYTQRKLNKENETNYDRRAAVISNVAATVSREATEFAFMMGSADQKAAFAHHSMMDRRFSNCSAHSTTRRSSISSTQSATRRQTASTKTETTRAPRRASLSSFIAQNKPVDEMDQSDRSTVSVGLPSKHSSPPRKIELRTTQFFGRKEITMVNRVG